MWATIQGVWRLVRAALWLGGLMVFALVTATVGVSLWIQRATQDRVFWQVDDVPQTEVGLVLGTSRFVDVAGERENLHFTRRMEAASALWHAGKVRRLIVSGAVTGQFYNEPREMRKVLQAKGVPESAIVEDAAGDRTFDSVVRAKTAFGVERLVIISDGFHTYRALFIAQHVGIEAVALAAQDIALSLSFKAKLREQLANVRALLDLYVLDTKPRVETGEA